MLYNGSSDWSKQSRAMAKKNQIYIISNIFGGLLSFIPWIKKSLSMSIRR